MWKTTTLLDYTKTHIPPGWEQFFAQNESILISISEKLASMNPDKIYPELDKVFRAFTDPDRMKVVWIGQDPYHDGSAVGLCFSVQTGTKINPSLRNIYREMESEGFEICKNGDLQHLSDQGCFMLNTALTVNHGSPDSHMEIWNTFSTKVVQFLVSRKRSLVWLLMGAKAQKLVCPLFTEYHRLVCTSHPSPFSALRECQGCRAFIGSGAFVSVNKILEDLGYDQIAW
jgi:uracil-DNA glycosylase